MSEAEVKAFQKLKQSIEENREKIEIGLKEGKDKVFELFKSMLGRMNPEKAALYAGLAYLGYENLPFHSTMVKIMWGPVGIELATTTAQGTATASLFGVSVPVNSQVAGLGMLAYLGFECLPWEELSEKINEQTQKNKDGVKSYQDALALYGQVMTEEEKADLDNLWLNVILTRHRRTDLTASLDSLIGYIEGMTPAWKERLGDNE